MSSFAASAHYDLLRQRCYSNKVTTARIITTSSMAYSGAYATHHHAWWKSNVSGTERLKQNVLSLQSEQPSISTYHRPSIWDLPSCICTNRLIGTLWFSLVDLSPTSSVCCNWNTSVLLLLCSSIDCNGFNHFEILSQEFILSIITKICIFCYPFRQHIVQL